MSIKKIAIAVPVLFLLLLPGIYAKSQLTCPGYGNYNVNGWTVLVDSSAIVNHSAETAVIVDHLDKILENVIGYNLAPAIVDTLLNIPIFMDWALDSGAAAYHPNLQWLIDNNYPVQKFKSINITNMRHFYDWTRKNNPGMIIHEMAHGYYFRKYWGTSVITDIANAYSRVVSDGIYSSVLHIVDSVSNNFASHYALTNQAEFFAEMSEAFITDYNDFYPFDKASLQAYDPDTYDLLSTIWFFDTPVSYPAHSNISRTGWSIWADSEESSTVGALKAIDGSSSTYWHTHWSGGVQTPQPHRYIIDLGSVYTVSGLKYLPTQPPSTENGRIKYFVLFVSDDGIDWDLPVASGTWANSAAEKTVRFTPVAARYIKLISRSEVHGYPYTSAAEINVLGAAPSPSVIAPATELEAGALTGETQSNREGNIVLRNYPNPFHDGTIISLRFPYATRVTLKITDLLGREVATLSDNEQVSAGLHEYSWGGKDKYGGAPSLLLLNAYYRDGAGNINSRTLKMVRK